MDVPSIQTRVIMSYRLAAALYAACILLAFALTLIVPMWRRVPADSESDDDVDRPAGSLDRPIARSARQEPHHAPFGDGSGNGAWQEPPSPAEPSPRDIEEEESEDNRPRFDKLIDLTIRSFAEGCVMMGIGLYPTREGIEVVRLILLRQTAKCARNGQRTSDMRRAAETKAASDRAPRV